MPCRAAAEGLADVRSPLLPLPPPAAWLFLSTRSAAWALHTALCGGTSCFQPARLQVDEQNLQQVAAGGRREAGWLLR